MGDWPLTAVCLYACVAESIVAEKGLALDSQSALLEGMEVFCGSVHLLRYGYGLGLFFFWLSCEPKKKEVKFDIDCSYILVSDPLQSPVRPTPSRRLNKLERPGYLSEWCEASSGLD